MKSFLIALAISLALVVPAEGQINLDARIQPTSGKSVGVVTTDVMGRRWLVLPIAGGQPLSPEVLPVLDKDGQEVGAKCIFEAPTGIYTVIQIPKNEDLPLGIFSVVLGPASPVPVPGPGPLPPPGPGPGPVPVPLDAFAAEALKWLKAVPNLDKMKALAIADNYSTIGSQGSDPARSQGWDLNSFVTKTKELNRGSLSTEELASWAAPFFRPLAEKQSQIFQERMLKTTDREAVAKLWIETGEAIRKAALSTSQ